MRAWRPVLIALLLCLAAQGVGAAGLKLAITGASDGFRERFSLALNEALTRDNVSWVEPRKADLTLALGDAAFREALALRRPVLGLFVSRDVALEAFTAGCGCSAFFSETDPIRQLRLARLLFPGAYRIGVLTSPGSAWVGGLLGPYAESREITLIHSEVADSNALARELPRLLSQVDVLLAVNDPQLYTAGTARLILLTSYRQNKPVIGPDELFVQAGSVATTFTSGEDMVQQAARAVEDYGNRGRLPPPDFATAFSVQVNQHVARSYAVPLLNEQALRQQLEAGE